MSPDQRKLLHKTAFFIERGLIGVLALAAILHLVITLSTLFAFTLHHPMQDQFRLNLRYLTVPFPLSVLELENGHHPVLPGIARYIELQWLNGAQYIQLATVWAAACAITLALARDAMQALPRVLAFACMALTVWLLWWNANARMFIHTYEGTHLFYVVFGSLAAVLSACAACRSLTQAGRVAWWGVAILACVGATFSFGPGIAAFVGLWLAALMLRRSGVVLTAIIVAAVLTFRFYLLVLPGAEGVQSSSRGFSFGASFYYFFARLSAPAYELLAFAGLGDAKRALVALPFGAIALLPAISLAYRLSRAAVFTRLEVVAAALYVLGLASNLVVAVNRTSYFDLYPAQVYADRYLFWGCIAWLGAGLYSLALLRRARERYQFAAAIAVALLAVVSLPNALWYNGWSAAVYRHVEVSAAGLAIGVRDDARMSMISDGLETTYRSVAAMRKAGTGGFGHEGDRNVGFVARVQPQGAPVDVAMTQGEAPGMVQGDLPIQTAKPLRRAVLWLAAEDGTLLGRVALASASRAPGRIPLSIGTLNRFEGYVADASKPVKWLGLLDQDTLTPIAQIRDMRK